MGGAGPTWRIDGPAPQAPPHSLLQSARVVDDVGEEGIERFPNGVTVYPYPVGPAGAWDPCSTGSNREKIPGAAVPIPEFDAFVVYLADECSGFSVSRPGMTVDQAQKAYVARVQAALEAIESAAVEAELMAGAIMGGSPDQPFLANGDGAFPWGDNPTTVVNAVAVLENEIAQTGRLGMLHCTPGFATTMKSHGLLELDPNGPLRTVNGNVVVPGFGYAQVDSTPDGGHPSPSALQEWVYATGPVELRRSRISIVPATLAEALDRETNTVEYFAERAWAVDWDTVLQAAVLADRCATNCGTPS